MRRIRLLTALATLPLLAATLRAAPPQERGAQPAPVRAERSGAEIYSAACQTCHGPDGRGNPKSHVGFDVALPDFTDCAFATPEAEADWFAIVSDGGPVRAFDRHMPAFREALTEEEIHRVVGHLRGFCAERKWPRGELNLPRPLVTEKAFPENEALLTTAVSRFGGAAVGNHLVYERRIGARAQWEVSIPIELQRTAAGGWSRGLGDVTVAIKHAVFHDVDRGSILSLGAEILLPTGKEATGFGKGVTILEPFVSVGQILPSNAFVQAQAGIGLPADRHKSAREAFWRVAAGQTFFHQRFHREWSPMLEVMAAKELADGKHTLWDLVPQLQVSLSRRHHVLVNGGFQVPVNDRAARGRTFRMYVLWDWFDGGLFSGW